jgi:GNAT superfamily N-acetyltransferase
VQVKYSIEQLTSLNGKASFSCGIESLDDFLKTKASQQAKKRLSATYVLLENDALTVIGYYTLTATSIPLDLLPADISKKFPRYPSLPATLLGRLAVDGKYQGKNLGHVLLYDALKKSLEYSESIGSMAVTVDAINDAAILFYKKYGFIHFVDCKDKLFLPMLTIRQLVED